jgi:2-polyprenyl-6-methoxyphenol hydroxylase-like FAD-dependent oxidoreductase
MRHADLAPRVLVVGAGPVGLSAAYELARRGLRVRIVDAATGPENAGRVVLLQPRTLETLDQMGVVEEVLRHGSESRSLTLHAGGGRGPAVQLQADYAATPTRHPYSFAVRQSRLAAVLREALAGLGVQVEWGRRLAGFTERGSGVRYRLGTADGGEEECATGWLVGCDGAVPGRCDGRAFVAGDADRVDSSDSGPGLNSGIQDVYNLAWKLAMVEQGYTERALLESYGAERASAGRPVPVRFRTLLTRAALPAVLTAVRRVPALRRTVRRAVSGATSGLRLGYRDSALTTGERPCPVPVADPIGSPVFVPVVPGAPGPGERAAAAAARSPHTPGPTALHAELREPRFSLLYAPASGDDRDPYLPVAARAARRHGAWLSVRTVGDCAPTAPAPLPDPGGELRDGLGLGAGGWVLIRPDGYVAARGRELDDEALARALVPLHLTPVDPDCEADPEEDEAAKVSRIR